MPVASHAKGRARSRETAELREKALLLISQGKSMDEVAKAVNRTTGTLHIWRARYPDWAAEVDATRQRRRSAHIAYDGSFLSFRLHYLNMETTWFQAKIANAIEKARPGQITLILIPPEHGKTTLLEDYCTYKLIENPSYRITVASETVDHGEKVVSRVRERFENSGPTPRIPADFGPIAPEQKADQVWGQRRFNVAGKAASDERDYSMNCVGITGRVQGTRCDLLLLDDVQDVKSLDQSEKYFQIIKQSFLSRPSMFGRTVIIGTRVGEYDVYRKILDARLATTVITIPAYSTAKSIIWPEPKKPPVEEDESTWAPKGVEFLWPDMYDREYPGGPRVENLHRYRYAALRWRVGEQTWWRIYMQRPEAASSMTFDEGSTVEMHDEHRSVIGEPTPIRHSEDARLDVNETRKVPIIVGVDPAIGGGNGTIVCAARPGRLEILDCRLDYGLTKNSQIAGIIGDYCHRYSTDNSVVTTVVIEDKAFQRGLLEDDSIIELRRRFGFRIVPNTTGREKTDKDVGVPSMQMAMVRHEITIPWADAASRKNMAPLLDHLHAWRPGAKATELPQDMVMALWFCWRRWRSVRDTPVHGGGYDNNAWRTAPSPLRVYSGGRRRKSRYNSIRGGTW